MRTQADTENPNRIDGLDLARALAIFGMIIVNHIDTYVVSAVASASAIIILCLMLCEQPGSPAWLRLLSTTGQLSLSIHLAHIVIGLRILNALGILYAQPLAFAFAYSLLFIVHSVAFANLWRVKWEHGPLEALMRRLS